MYQTIKYIKEDAIGVLTIDRPEALNALNSTVISELEQLIGEVEKDLELRALIITGAGRSFVAGADIGEMSTLTKAEGTSKTSLLIHGEERLDCWMLKAIVKKHSQSCSHTNTAVSTKCCILSLYPLAINPCLDRVILEVELLS